MARMVPVKTNGHCRRLINLDQVTQIIEGFSGNILIVLVGEEHSLDVYGEDAAAFLNACGLSFKLKSMVVR